MEKICTTCGITQGIREFGLQVFKPPRKNVIKPSCRTCARDYARRRRDLGNGIAYAREYNARESTKSRNRVRLKSQPHRRAAHKAVWVAIDRGELIRAKHAPCADADGTCLGRHEYHHDSYLRKDWLSVRALCRSHHARWHRDNTPTPYDGGE